MYLASQGHYASFTSRPLVLAAPELTMNARAPQGDVVFQITDLCSRPIPGFTFEECVPFERDDRTDAPLRWKEKSLAELTGRVVRLDVRFRNAHLYAFRGDFHFVDALDVALIDDGKPIDGGFMDF